MPESGFEESVSARVKASESLRVTWLIIWRTTALLLLASVVVVPVFRLGLTGILASTGMPAALIAGILQLVILGIQPILILPVAITMMLGKEFKGFEVQVERADHAVSDLSYTEALPPAWLLYWRTTILVGIPMAGLIFLLSLVDLHVIFAGPLGALWIVLLGLPLNWLVVHSMFQKKFRKFHFTVKRFA